MDEICCTLVAGMQPLTFENEHNSDHMAEIVVNLECGT